MTGDSPLLDRAAIQDAFRRLGDRLARRGVVAPGGDAAAPHVFDHPGLRVSAASPEHLLAMKVLAARRRDAEDISYLVKHLGLSGAAEVLEVMRRGIPR